MDALIVVDMQVGLLNGEPKHDLHGVIERINRLAAKVRERSGVVIFVQHCGGEEDDFVPENAGLGASARTQSRGCRYRHSQDPERSLCRHRPRGAPERDRAGRGSSSRDGQPISASMPRCGLPFQTTTMSSWSTDGHTLNDRPHLDAAERHPSPPLGLGQSDHAAIGQARAYGRTAALTGLPDGRLAPRRNRQDLASSSSSRTMPANAHDRCGIGEYS